MYLKLVRQYRLSWFTRASLMAILLIAMVRPIAAQDNPPVNFHLYLIGDAGKLTVQDASFKAFLQRQLKTDTVPSAIVFLGDNIYPSGMPPEGHRQRRQTEQILAAQLALAEGFKGDIIFVPGNHDWKKGKSEGLNYILNQQAWLDSLKKENVKMLPGNGCPGPIEIELAENLVLVVIDTQWWLHPWDKPKDEASTCEAKTEADIIIQLDDILHRNSGKRVVVAGHHPLVTYGDHGGYFSVADHLFPLTNLNKNLYIPMPVLGSIYPLYRKIFGDIQDMAHPQYKRMAAALNKLFSQYPGVVYASGHDHSLQYASNSGVHYVISGSGVNSSNVKKGKLAEFVSAEAGYVRMRVSNNTQAQFEYVTNASIPFQKIIAPLPVIDKTVVIDSISKVGRVRVKASSRYAASQSRERWLGKNYRAEWSQEIEVPVFDLGKERGGLKVIQRGGGRQTLSLRLQDSLGKEYTLRSIDKFPEKALPEVLRQTFAEDLVQDQISAAHPYAAVVIPLLAQAAGIYHPNPKVVYIPDDPRLGIYRKDFAGQVMLFEERASGSGHAMDFFGNSDAMIGSEKMLEQLIKDNDNAVDQKFFLRSRLFDMWIGDWDRHEDQWRWAVFESKKGKTYRPIPRDRDQAFFVNQGRIPKFIGKPFLLFQFEGFNDAVRWPSGLMFSGRFIDRKFLTELTKEDWLAVADDLTHKLTDAVIDSALHQWPDEIYKIHGAEIARKLKARRSLLQQNALEHYLFLSRIVSIAGSDKSEKFEIDKLGNGNVVVSIFKLNKQGETGKPIYRREFDKNETKEIRLYGLGADDQFILTGESTNIKIRIIGGDGNDVVHASNSKQAEVYDVKNGISISDETAVKNKTSNYISVNEYNWRDYRYNRTAPLVYLNYNVDDGVFLGTGVAAIRHGFRKQPFKSKHILLGSYAINTSSFNFQYDGTFTDIVGKWDLKVDADIKAPNYVNNFFGWGNESVFDKNINAQPDIDAERPIDFYRVRFHEIKLQTQLMQKVGQWGFFRAGPVFQRIEVEEPNEDRFIGDYATSVDNLLEQGKKYGGLTTTWGIDKRNHPFLTTRGVYLEQTSAVMRGFNLPDFTAHHVKLSFYQSFRFPAIVTFATRVGGGINTGHYEFFNAQILDGKTELRGFRKTRFYGDKKLYFNNEMRIKLGSIQSYLFPAHIGILGFYDVGRIWYKDESGIDPTSATGTSSVWHKGFGGGLWFTPFNLATVSTEVGHSVEGTLVYVRLGFMF
jgi:hypothetical protein